MFIPFQGYLSECERNSANWNSNSLTTILQSIKDTPCDLDINFQFIDHKKVITVVLTFCGL